MWTSQEPICRFSNSILEASWNVANPAEGFFDVHLRGQPLHELRVLQCRNSIAAAEPVDYLVDHYVREDDLVTTLVQAPKRGNRKQVYLRSAGFQYPEAVLGFEMIFSMQTDRLDGDPRLQIRSDLTASRIWGLDHSSIPNWEELNLAEDAIDLTPTRFGGAFAFELGEPGKLYVQFLDPSDFFGGRLLKMTEGSNRVALSLPVFGETMEKGVIRRGRVTGLFLEGVDSLEIATRFFQWYRLSSPPLSA